MTVRINVIFAYQIVASHDVIGADSSAEVTQIDSQVRHSIETLTSLCGSSRDNLAETTAHTELVYDE